MILRSLSFLVLLSLFAANVLAQQKPTITLSPNGCQGLSVLISDYATADQGLADVEVLWDSLGVYTGESYMSYNVDYDGPEPTGYYQDPTAKFKIRVIDPTDTAYAAIWAINHTGRSSIAEWTSFKPLQMKADPYRADLSNDSIGAPTCTHYSLKNRGNVPLSFSQFLQPQRGGFSVTNLQPAGGSQIQPGQSISFDVCYASHDTMTVYDTAHLLVDCYNVPVPLVGTAVAPIIEASDVTFNGIEIGDTDCGTIRVWNRGNGDLVLSGNSTHTEFTLQGNFPDRIAPHSYRDYDICFAPKGSYGARVMDIVWTTNEPPVYAHGNKDVSHVTGISSTAGLHWDRTTALFDPEHDTLEFNVMQIWIKNTSSKAKTLDSIVIGGPEGMTFAPYLSSFPRGVTLNADQQISIRIQWQPIVPPPVIQTGTGYLMSGGVAVDSLFFTGLYPQLSVTPIAKQAGFELFPNPLNGHTLHVTLSESSPAFVEILDLLGQNVVTSSVSGGQADIALPTLLNGTYFVRMTQGSVMRTKRLVIER